MTFVKLGGSKAFTYNVILRKIVHTSGGQVYIDWLNRDFNRGLKIHISSHWDVHAAFDAIFPPIIRIFKVMH